MVRESPCGPPLQKGDKDRFPRFSKRGQGGFKAEVLRVTLGGIIASLLASTAAAQLGGKSVSEDAGPVSETSRTISDDSRPVHESGRTTHESSVGALSGNSTRESAVAPMKSGSLSEISAGTVTSNRSLVREKAEARLAPAPPRIVWEETVDTPVEWQPYYDLDALVDELSTIQPIARAETPPDDEGSSEPAVEGEAQVGD